MHDLIFVSPQTDPIALASALKLNLAGVESFDVDRFLFGDPPMDVYVRNSDGSGGRTVVSVLSRLKEAAVAAQHSAADRVFDLVSSAVAGKVELIAEDDTVIRSREPIHVPT